MDNIINSKVNLILTNKKKKVENGIKLKTKGITYTIYLTYIKHDIGEPKMIRVELE